jgi:hypothetical protein
MNAITFEEMQYIDTPRLCALYHHAQLAYVDCVVNLRFHDALDMLIMVLRARCVVWSRYETTDIGHRKFYETIKFEIRHLEDFLQSGRQYYAFRSATLVNNALDAGIFVPEHFRPATWYARYQYVQ